MFLAHLKVFIAYGPFTTGNDISKFSKLIITAQKSQADALILVGFNFTGIKNMTNYLDRAIRSK
jgi:hypothetical protein